MLVALYCSFARNQNWIKSFYLSRYSFKRFSNIFSLSQFLASASANFRFYQCAFRPKTSQKKPERWCIFVNFGVQKPNLEKQKKKKCLYDDQKNEQMDLKWFAFFFVVGTLLPEEKNNINPENISQIHNSSTIHQDNSDFSFFGKLWYFAQCLIRFLVLVYYILPLIITSPILFSKPLSAYWWAQICYTLEKLGGSWIKLGQWASTRHDIFSDDLILHMSKLCHDCPAHSFEDTREIIENTYNCKIHEIFPEFSEKPIASGALAQIHVAVLNNGNRVAVKVLHPNIGKIIQIDLSLMKFFANLIEMLPGTKWMSLSDSVQQFSGTMHAQSDLRIEANNLERFNRNFQNNPHVSFPKLVKEVEPAEFVFVETFEEGEILQKSKYFNSVSKESKALAKIGLDAYLKMMLVDNFVHADLHPGNIIVKTDTKGKVSLVLLDVGLVCESSPDDWYKFKALFRAIVEGNGKHGAHLMIKFAKDHNLSPEQEEKFVNAMGEIFTSVRHKKLVEIRVGEFLRDVLSLVRNHHVKIEGNFATLCVGTIVLEGVGRKLDPDLNLLDASVPLFIQGEVIPENKTVQITGFWEMIKRKWFDVLHYVELH